MKKILFISLAVIMALSIGLIGCEGEGEGEGEGELPSIYIGSGALDGDGIPVDFFSDIDVRKAFCYAFDYDTYIEEALSGQGIHRGSPVVEGLYGYWAGTPMYEYDLVQAVAHMQDAWEGEAWDKGFKFTLLYNAGNLPRKTACEMVSEKWAAIGADEVEDAEHFLVSVQALAWPTILGKIFGTRDMPMFQIGWLPDYPHADNFIVPFMSSHGTFSYFQGYGDAALDADIAAAFQELDGPTQLSLYADLQQRYYDDAPGIVLAQPIARRYFTGHIDGYIYNPCESSYIGQIMNLSKVEDQHASGIPYENPGSFIEMTIGEVDSLDPAWLYDTASGENVGRIYDTLIYYDGNSTSDFVPVLTTDDGTFNATDNTLRFTIQTGIEFHEGGTLTPEDVEYSFERAMCQDRPGGPIWMFYQALLGEDVWGYEDTTFGNITAAVEVDGQDVVFTLAGAYWEIAFKQVLCGQWASIVDKSWCIDTAGDWDGTEGDVVNYLHPENNGDTPLYELTNGTGPYELNTWDHGVEIIVDKFANYHGDPQPFDDVTYKVVEEWTTRKLALLAGTADLAYVPATNFDEMDLETGLHVYTDLPSLSIDAFFFNMIIGGPEE